MLQITNHWDEKLLALLENNEIGTPGKSMVYQHLKVKPKLEHIHHPHFVNLNRNNKILGTCCFCERSINFQTSRSIGFYIRYFTFQLGFRTNNRIASRRSKDGHIKSEIKKILRGTELNKTVEKQFFYAYVDPKNERSGLICEEFGFDVVRTFQTITFSRFFPKKSGRVQLLPVEEREQMIKKLQEFYQHHTMYTEENLFFEDGYYVIKNEQGEVLAGLQASKEKWSIKSLPGPNGVRKLHWISKIPLINRLINKNFEFLAIESVYFSDDYSLISELLESLLAKFSVNVAMIAVDDQSLLYQSFQQTKPGPLHILNKPVQAGIIVKTIGMNKDEGEKFVQNPAYISTLDLV